MNTALLVLRIIPGLLLIGHGLQKLVPPGYSPPLLHAPVIAERELREPRHPAGVVYEYPLRRMHHPAGHDDRAMAAASSQHRPHAT
jgi:hypothetical protein